MNESIEYSIFSNNLKSSREFNSSEFGIIKFKWNIENVSQRKILRYSIDDLQEIYEIEYDIMLKESNVKDLESYFLNVIKMLEYQVILYKEGEYDDLHEDDIKFIKYFENKYNIKHTQGDFK